MPQGQFKQKPHVKKPRPTDVAVGNHIRVHRISAGYSQTALANALGVTFQQVQKYEKGVNRVGASRLVQIADFFGVPVVALFPQGAGGPEGGNPHLENLSILTTREGQRLAAAWDRIDNDVRRAIVVMAEAAAGIARPIEETITEGSTQ